MDEREKPETVSADYARYAAYRAYNQGVWQGFAVCLFVVGVIAVAWGMHSFLSGLTRGRRDE